nr:MAG TPA: hypothetical protein [Caudoviricetes sp.]DAT48996.1 MAG TPA: hypothetical protein [Caudoviricetes sp.]
MFSLLNKIFYSYHSSLLYSVCDMVYVLLLYIPLLQKGLF